jgi:hypothetical protein
MTRPYVLLGLLVTAACTRSVTVPTTLSQTVPVAVIQPCLKPGQKPRQPRRLVEDQPVAPATLTEMVGRLRAKLKEWQDDYGPSADELLTVCEKVKRGDEP